MDVSFPTGGLTTDESGVMFASIMGGVTQLLWDTDKIPLKGFQTKI